MVASLVRLLSRKVVVVVCVVSFWVSWSRREVRSSTEGGVGGLVGETADCLVEMLRGLIGVICEGFEGVSFRAESSFPIAASSA